MHIVPLNETVNACCMNTFKEGGMSLAGTKQNKCCIKFEQIG